MKRLEFETAVYNEKRYGKPWIASIKILGNDLTFDFGTWVGQAGYEGLLILDCNSKVYAKGQKDNRKSSNSTPNFYLTETDEPISKIEAFKLLRSIKTPEKENV